MKKRAKISICGGAGFTGSTAAHWIASMELGDVVMLDIPNLEGPVKGKALDLLQAGPVMGFDANVVGTSSYADTADSDIVIITAGIARKPGMSREDLVSTNTNIVKSVTEQALKHSPGAYLIVLTNPLDAMAWVAYQVAGLPRNRVIGQSGILDTARYRTFISQELKVSVEDVSAFVLGGHGDDMVPLTRYTYAGGIPIDRLLPRETIDRIVERTKKGGGEIVQLLGTGSAYFAPAAALAQMVEAILKDKRRILPCAAYLQGEYGYSDVYMGVPVILGGDGMEKIIELELTPAEKAMLDRTYESVRATIAATGLR